MRIHLDTDLGGDPDDACALAMLLGWPGVELVGITTNLEQDGQRAGCTAHVLALAGRTDIPIAAGAGSSLSTLERFRATWGDPRHWPEPVEPRPGPPGAAIDLLAASIAGGATIVTIGALTNLALLEVSQPGSLAGVPLVVMGGWVRPFDAGFPPWDRERYFNLQCDARSAEIVLTAGAELTLAAMPAAAHAQLRAAHLPRLRAAGALGGLLARQSEAHASERDMAQLARHHAALADDLVNFHWDPVTCAVALGWDGATVEAVALAIDRERGVLRMVERDDGHRAQLLTAVDGPAFDEVWLAAVERAAGIGGRAGG